MGCGLMGKKSFKNLLWNLAIITIQKEFGRYGYYVIFYTIATTNLISQKMWPPGEDFLMFPVHNNVLYIMTKS